MTGTSKASYQCQRDRKARILVDTHALYIFLEDTGSPSRVLDQRGSESVPNSLDTEARPGVVLRMATALERSFARR